MQGICVDTGSTTVLREGQKYYVFDHGPNNYYVSKFDNVNAHMGSYRKTHFKLVEDEPFEHPGELLDDGRVIYSFENPEIEPVIEQPEKLQPPRIKLQRFVARVAKHRNGYRIDDLFIISEKGPNGYYHVYLKDRPAKGPVGSYITNFFEIIMPYDEVETKEAVKTPEMPKLEAQPKKAAIPLPEAVEAEDEVEKKPRRAKKVKSNIPDGQMDIFDFLEG